MKKYFAAVFIFFLFLSHEGYSQFGKDGSYLWNTVQVNHKFNPKYEVVFTNRVFYNHISDRMDFYFFDLTGYRMLTRHFSLGLGLRRIESYKSDRWDPVNVLWTYGIIYAQTVGMKFKIANRFGYKTYRDSESQLALDNISTVDFFTNSKNRIPKPYLLTEVFSELKSMKIQNVRIFTGLHLLKFRSVDFDGFCALWKSNTSSGWKSYNVYGLATKIRI